MGKYDEYRKIVNILGQELYELLEKYCDDKSMDKKEFIRSATATAMGLTYIPEHYEPEDVDVRVEP